MPADLTKARAAAQRVYAARDGFHARLAVLADASPPLRYRAQWADADTRALAFTVTIEATDSTLEDLKALMADANALNDGTRKWRRAVGLKPEQCDDRLDPDAAVAVAVGMLEREIDKLRHDLDAMSELGETESLRLQMAMDRMAKMMSTLSNILKKISDTSQQIIQNLK